MTYDPTIGKWLSEDPIGFASGTTNLLEYVGNAPTNGIDPTGLALEVEGETITAASAYYRKTIGKTERAIIDAMMQSKTRFVRSEKEIDLEIRFRSNMVKAAQAINDRAPMFPERGENFIEAPGASKFWGPDEEGNFGRGLHYKGEPYKHSFSEAIDELWATTSGLKCDCSAALTLVYLRALRDTLGKEEFDLLWSNFQAIYKTIPRVSQRGGNFTPGYFNVSGGPPIGGLADRYYTDHLPGDWSAFENKDVTPNFDWAWGAENVIVMPDDKFYGHGIGIKSREVMLDELAKRAGEKRTAKLIKQWNFDPRALIIDIDFAKEATKKRFDQN
jgi:protein-glutamine gamma-glutamyltransferase